MPPTRSRRDPATFASSLWLLLSPLLNLAGILTRRPTLQFVGMSIFVVGAVIGVRSFARSIRNGWPYPDGISPADKLSAAREAEGIVPDSLAVVYRRWGVGFLRGLIGRRRFAARDRITTWIVIFALIAFWATFESFGDVGVGGLPGFLTELTAGTAILCVVIAWIETADRRCARRIHLGAAHEESVVLTR